MAELLDSPCVQVTLRLPPPLGSPMELRRSGDKLELLTEGKLVAEAICSELELEIPDPPSLSQAKEASRHYIGHQHHPFPTCFVCGPEREDGLSIFAGPLREQVAANWTPAREFDGGDGHVAARFMWCALDCPGAFTVDQNMENPRVLGRLVGKLFGPLPVEKPAVILGWPLGTERRKAFAGTAIFDAEGHLCAAAKATWIALS